MSDNYYESLIAHIESLMKMNDFKQAKTLVEEELSMPFVPKDTLSKLETLKEEIDFQLAEPVSTKMMTPEQIYDALKQQNERSYKALEVLAMSNIRQYLEVIKDLLEDTNINHILKALLIEQLSYQQIGNIITYVDEGRVYSLIPSSLPGALMQENYTVICEMLEKKIPSNPSFLMQAKMVLVNVIYDRYPRLITSEENEKITNSIIRYVYRAYGDTTGWDTFKKRHNIEEKQLEEYSF